jgi:zinc D-Ala-D-Ala carboxypeptidase
LRVRVGKPLILRSAYRSPEHNRAVGGAKASKHMEGIAFDIAMANHGDVRGSGAGGRFPWLRLLSAIRLHAHVSLGCALREGLRARPHQGHRFCAKA